MRKSYTVREDDLEIRKGPWTAEEDEILTNFVKKYGPRDWSSIRSKGLLPRTGKSCRLRWVNKLRPNLKVGCKFSAEEERLVVEMQSRIGNKWAAIASYLSGRTDNDVKNFWSSRQKRLARIFHSNISSATSSSSSSSSSSSKLLRNSSWRTASKFKSNSPVNYQVPPSREDICTTMHVKQEASSASTTTCMMPAANIINMMKNPELSAQAPESINPELVSLHSHCLIDPLITQPPSLSQPSVLLFSTDLYQPPEQPPLVLDQSRDIPIVSAGLGCLDLYPHGDAAVHDEFGVEPQFNIDSPFFGLDCGRVLNVGAAAAGVDMEDQLLATPDSFFDDFPTDVFDSLDPFPTSSER